MLCNLIIIFVSLNSILVSCSINGYVRNVVNTCIQDYTVFNEDKEKYDYDWETFNPSYTESNPQMINVYKAFQYTRSDDIDGSPYFGVYNNYWGGGFIYNLYDSQSTQTSDLINNITQLQKLDWIDRQTRAVFVEVSLFNPNANLFAYVTILFEYLPSGNILPSIRIAPMSLIEYNSSYLALKVACNILYLIFIVYFMVKEIKELMKTKPKILYFKRLWSYVEWAIVGFSWAAFAMYLYRIYEGDKISRQFKEYNSASSQGKLIRLQSMANWNESLALCLGFCALLGTLKFLRLLRFNTRISIFVESMKQSLQELTGFFLLFMLMFMSFVQLLYLTLNDKISGFSTMIKTMQSCFEIMLGKFEVDPIWQANMVLGPLFFSIYNIVIIFILLNIFLTIVSTTFARVRLDALKNAHKDIPLVDFIVTRLKRTLIFWKRERTEHRIQLSYKNYMSTFPKKVDELVKYLVILYNINNKLSIADININHDTNNNNNNNEYEC